MSIAERIKSLKEKTIISSLEIILKRTIKPNHNWDRDQIPGRPNYTLIDNWIAHPSTRNNAQVSPHGIKNSFATKEVDVFFIYPTLFFSKNHWNAPLDFQSTNDILEHMVMPGMASVFHESCNIYSPRYRQATFYSFVEASDNSQRAFHLAYQDIEEAFQYYLKYENKGRPFIVAGHSQGTLHGIRLLEEQIDPFPEIRERMIAAYLVGFQIPRDKFDRTIRHIKMSKNPLDSNVVVGWDSYGLEGSPLDEKDNTQHFYPDTTEWEFRRGKKVVSVNPLSFTNTRGWIDPSQNLGGIRTRFTSDSTFDWRKIIAEEPLDIEFASLSPPLIGEVGAQLDAMGILHISEPKTTSFTFGLLPKQNYHIHDYGLFYMNMRKNIKERTQAFLQKKIS